MSMFQPHLIPLLESKFMLLLDSLIGDANHSQSQWSVMSRHEHAVTGMGRDAVGDTSLMVYHSTPISVCDRD
jgi:hypothetical protein